MNLLLNKAFREVGSPVTLCLELEDVSMTPVPALIGNWGLVVAIGDFANGVDIYRKTVD
jgi:hypothetical protein